MQRSVYRGDQQGVQILQHTTSSSSQIMILPVQRKLTNFADVPSALSLPSEEQYSKCTYPLCFDFSQCPLTQPFHAFVYIHHFRNLFNLKYPATVDSFVTQSSHLTHVLTNPHKCTHIHVHIVIYTHLLIEYYVKCCQCILKILTIMLT